VEEPRLAWRVWPAAERPAQAVAVGLALIGAAIVGGIYGGDPLLAAVALCILVGSLASYYFPTRIQIDGDGIETATFWGAKRRSWDSLRSYAADPRGITVSPYRRPSVLESYRGLRVLYGPAADRAVVLARVQSRLPAMEPRRGPRR
jgi:hypothetical protein